LYARIGLLLMNVLQFVPTRVLFFTGKGGVGKTSEACATAIRLADAGKRVLLVSTDPASNLDEVLGVTLDASPKTVPGVPGLSALNIDPEQAAHAYRERVVGPYRGVLPATAVASIEEQLSGACTVEIAAFDEFSKLLGDADATRAFDHLIFDTAPTGHTLRLLELPPAWSTFSKPTWAARRVSVRSRASKRSNHCMPPRTRRCAMRRRRPSSWWRVPMRHRSRRPSARAANCIRSGFGTCG
jgi:TRC40/GET3/ArsA family transport-energizing ATPase